MIQRAVASGLLTFDIGTSSIKAGFFDRSTGNALWLHREPLPTDDRLLSSWQAERWVRGVQSAIDQLPVGMEIQAIVFSGNGPTIIPVSPDGSALEEALLWLDPRESRRREQHSFFLPKISWIDENRRELFDATWQFMTCPEYIAYLMTDVSHTTSPSREFDPFVWDLEGLAAYGVDAGKVPPLVRPGDQIGTTSRRAHDVFHLEAGIPVIAGGPDFLMSLLGTATVEPGLTCDRAGTSEGINFCSGSLVNQPIVRCLPHVVPGLYNVAGVLASTGRIFEWFRGISRQRTIGYQRILDEIVAAGFDHEPYFFPSMHEGAAWEFSKGLFVGLRSDHATAELGRGVVYSIGYAVRQSISTLQLTGCEVSELRACGGQAKNSTWNQMKADITGLPVLVPEVVDAELVGNLCCGRVGLGDFDTAWAASRELVRFFARFDPDGSRHEQFGEGYERYLATYKRYADALRDADQQM